MCSCTVLKEYEIYTHKKKRFRSDFVALFLLQRLPYQFIWSRHAGFAVMRTEVTDNWFVVDSFAASSLRMIFVVKQAADVFCWFRREASGYREEM